MRDADKGALTSGFSARVREELHLRFSQMPARAQEAFSKDEGLFQNWFKIVSGEAPKFPFFIDDWRFYGPADLGEVSFTRQILST